MEKKIFIAIGFIPILISALVYFTHEPTPLKEQLLDSIRATQSGQTERARNFLIEAYQQHGEENLFSFFTAVFALLNRGYIDDAGRVLDVAKASLASEFEVWQEGQNLGKSKFTCFLPIFVRTQMRDGVAEQRIAQLSTLLNQFDLKWDPSYCNKSALPTDEPNEIPTEQYKALLAKLPQAQP